MKWTKGIVAAWLVMAGTQAVAQDGRPAWEDYDKRIEASRKVAPLGPDLLGDLVSLQTGSLSFEATDVSVPGNNALPVAFTRRYTVMNRRDYGSVSDGMLDDWKQR